MKVIVNGKERFIKESVNIKELLRLLDIEFREVGLAVSVNGEVVPKSEYESTYIKEGDSIEIVQLVGGG